MSPLESPHVLVPGSELGGEPGIDHPMILDVDRVVVDVQNGATDRGKVFEARLTWREEGNEATVGVENRQAFDVGQEIRVEDISGRRLGSASSDMASVLLVASLGLMAPALQPGARRAACELPVVAAIRVRRVEI